MDITQSNTSRQISISNLLLEGFNYVHCVVKLNPSNATLYDYTITDNSSSFALYSDGLYYLVSFKLPLSSIISGKFYINDNKIFKVGTTLEYTPIDLLNLSDLEYDFGIDKEVLFLLHKYSLTKNIRLIKKYLDNNNCSAKDPNKKLLDTLEMGQFVTDELFNEQQWNKLNIIMGQLSSCNNPMISNNSLPCNCNG